MKKYYILGSLIGLSIFLSSLSQGTVAQMSENIDSLRYIYSRTSDRWPMPFIDDGVEFVELGIIPGSPLDPYVDSLKPVINLGKIMFFDPRLSGSNQISCSSCHAPDLGWADGRALAVGHDHQRNTRNSQSIENSWFYTSYFWDGRASTLEEQAANPIANPVEMHQDFEALPKKLQSIKGYSLLFEEAYGTTEITNDRITNALAIFQRTVTSGVSDFDYFLAGLSSRLDDDQILGLHLFRTKARCMNCHNGPFFTDNKFHNLNTTFYKDPKREDFGLYNTTKNPLDVGKFRTPGLRNVMQTGPWFHNGIFTDMRVVMTQYNMGMRMLGAIIETPDANDPMKPVISPHIKTLSLTLQEVNAVISFIESLSTIRTPVDFPELPQ